MGYYINLEQTIDEINNGVRNRLAFGWLAQFAPGLSGLALMAFGLPIARSESEIGGQILQTGGVVLGISLLPKLAVSLIPGMNQRSRWARLLSIVICAVAVFYWQFFNRLNIVPETPHAVTLGVLIGVALIVEIGYLTTELSEYFGWLPRRSA